MVANIRSGSSPSRDLRYNKEKADKNEVANTLLAEDVGTVRKHGQLDVDACMVGFWPYLEVNCRTINMVFHASLNPSPEDKLTDEQLREIAREYMERMGWQPALHCLQT